MVGAFALGCSPVDGGFRSLDADAFEQYISATENVLVLDSRTAQEYVEGHISNALNIDVNGADFEAQALGVLDKNRPVAVYCRSGRRSKRAAGILVKNGYNVVELDCGIICWVNAGKEIVK